MTSVLISDVVTLRERGKWQGYLNVFFTAGASAGGPIGGILTDRIGWRWVFLGQAPIAAAAFIAIALFVEKRGTEDGTAWEKLKRIDFLGAFWLILAVTALLVGLDRGSNAGWDDMYAVAALLASPILTAIFFLVEMKFAANPFAPVHVIFNRKLAGAYICGFFVVALYRCWVYCMPVYFQAVKDMTSGDVGVLLIPITFAGVSGSLIGGFFIERTGRYKWMSVTAMSVATLLWIPLYLSTAVVQSTVGIMANLVIINMW